jgi:thiol-disulfide isomerase/thioredoxin
MDRTSYEPVPPIFSRLPLPSISGMGIAVKRLSRGAALAVAAMAVVATAAHAQEPTTVNSHAAAPVSALPVEGMMPSLAGAVEWLNSKPLDASTLRGKVVVVNFWTYSCINCLRTLPYLKAWQERYGKDGLVVVGVHAPEFAFERDVRNVKRATSSLGITYPVAVDSHYAIWQAFSNQYWPAFYIVDAQGRIRYHNFGEGGYDRSEQVIRQLLAEAGRSQLSVETGGMRGQGAQAPSDQGDLRSPETYVGYRQGERFAAVEPIAPDAVRNYTVFNPSALNTWSLSGRWKIGAERAELADAPGRIVYRFHARDLHMVLGPAAGGKPVRFRVTIDGAPPGAAHGSDVSADGSGTIDRERLYQLVRQKGAVGDRTFVIEFLDPGASAYSFTFG